MQKSKKLLVVFLLIFLLVFSFALTSCEEKELKIDKTAETIEVGATVTVKATYGDAAISGDALKFAMDKEGIITIAASGDSYVITGVKKGTVVVTFSVDDKSVTVTITVNDTAGDAAAALAAAKTAKIAELDALLATYAQANYSTANWAILTGYITTAKATVNSATTVTAVNAVSKTTVKASCDTVKTLAQEQAEADAAAAAAALAEAKVAKKAQIDALLANYIQANYSVEGWAQIVGIIDGGKAAVDALTIKADVEAYSTAALTTACGKIPTAAQEKALADAKKVFIGELNTLQELYDINIDDYSDENWAALQAIIINAKAQINAYTNLADLQTYRLANVQTACAAIFTIAQTEALEAAREDLLAALEDLIGDYDEDDYSAAKWAKIVEIIDKANADTIAAITIAQLPAEGDIREACDAVLTLEGEEELATAIEEKYEEITNLLKEYNSENYSAARWTSFNLRVAKEKATIAALPNADAVAAHELTGLTAALNAILTIDQEETFETAKVSRKAAFDALLKDPKYKNSLYSTAGQAALRALVAEFKEDVDACTIQAELEALSVSALETELDKVPDKADEAFTAAKNTKIAALNTLLATYKQANYTTTEWTTLKGYVTTAITAATDAANQGALDAVVVATVKSNCDAVLTIAKQLTNAKTALNAKIDDFITSDGVQLVLVIGEPAVACNVLEGDYFAAEWNVIKGIIADAKATVNSFTIIELVNSFEANLKTKVWDVLDAVLEEEDALDAQKAAKTAALNAILTSYKADDYDTNWNFDILKEDPGPDPYDGINTIITKAKAIVTAATVDNMTAFNALDIPAIKVQCALVPTELRLQKDAAIALLNDGMTIGSKAYGGFNDYTKADYSTTNWNALKKIFDDAKAAVEAFTDIEDLDEYVNTDTLKNKSGVLIAGTSALELAVKAGYDILDKTVTGTTAEATRKNAIIATGTGSIDTAFTGMGLTDTDYSKVTASTGEWAGARNFYKRITDIVAATKTKVSKFTKTSEYDEFEFEANGTTAMIAEINAVLKWADVIDLGADEAEGGTGENADTITYYGEKSLIAARKAVNEALDALLVDYTAVKASYYAAQWTDLTNIIKNAKAAVTAAYTWEELFEAVNEGAIVGSAATATEITAFIALEENALIPDIMAAVNKVYTISAEDAFQAAKADKLAELDLLFGNYDVVDYSVKNWTTLTGFIEAARTEIGKFKTIEDVIVYNLAAVEGLCEAVEDIYDEIQAARDAKLEDLEDLDDEYDRSDYTAAGVAMLNAIYNAKVNAINNLDDVTAILTFDLTAVEAEFDAVMTELELAKEDAYAILDALLATYDQADYSTTNWNALKNKIKVAKAAVKALASVSLVEDYDFEAVKALCDAIATLD